MIRRSKIKARPKLKKSQAPAKSTSQNPQPAASAPGDNQQKINKCDDEIAAQSTSVEEKCHLNVNNTTATSENHPTCNLLDNDIPSPPDVIVADPNHPTAEPHQHTISTVTNESNCNDTSETALAVDSNLKIPQPSLEVESQESSLPSATTITTIDDTPGTGKLIAENKKAIESKKPPMPGGRRRKIMACPTAAKKRRKTDARSETTRPDMNSAVSVLNNDKRLKPAAPDSETTLDITPLKNPEPTDVGTLDLEACNPNAGNSEEMVLVDVAALTTINEVASTHIAESPIFGINPAIDETVTGDAPIAPTVPAICDSTPEISTQLLLPAPHPTELLKSDAAQQPESETLPKIPHPKNCTVKIKSASLSSKYRSKAFEKLNRMKQNQSDGGEWPELDQNYVSMSDLIFLNPPAKVGHRLGMNADEDQPSESVMEPTTTSEGTSETVEDNNNDKALPVPQIRIAEDGSVVVDEESLVLDTQKPQNPSIRTVYETGKDTGINQRSFLRRSFAKSIRWSVEDTNEFYRCLCIVGAEFTLMSAMFRGRSPDNLRRKFRREHKKNPVRVDQALMQQHLSKWTDDMFKANEPSSSLILKPPQETQTQS